MVSLSAVKGDITQLDVEAIVNAANTSLLGGGGVDGAIHKAAGKELLKECRKLNGCTTGDAKITKGYNLKARHVIHTVGPVWKGGNKSEPDLLKNCYKRSIEIASEKNIKSIAFPCISTGIYHFPKKEAASIAFNTIKELTKENDVIEEVIFSCFSEQDFEIYNELICKKNI